MAKPSRDVALVQPRDGLVTRLVTLDVLFRYLSATHPRMGPEKVADLLMGATNGKGLEDIVEYTNVLKEKARREGKLEGRAEALLDQLAARFGKVPAAVKERIRAADQKVLATWTLRVLTAATLAEVLDGEEAAAKPRTRGSARRSAAAPSRRTATR